MNNKAGLFIFICSSALYGMSYEKNQLTKLFYHQGLLSDKVVCYFDKTPICNYVPMTKEEPETLNTSQKEAIFLLPRAVVSTPEAQQSIKQVNTISRDHYTIRIVEVKKPIEGIKVVINYDPSKIVCDYALFDAISQQKGLVFSFHNKKGLSKIKRYANSILRQASLPKTPKKKVTVMLDYGHGGHDDGKIGCGLVKEKDINMQIGGKVAEILKKKGYEVILTRNSDIFVPLDERTRVANEKGVDFFISIHANAGPCEASGIETYWTARSDLKRNFIKAFSENHLEQLNTIHQWLDTASRLLAATIHEQVIKTAACYHPVNDRRVKQSVAQVLLGTDMPSALIELGFLTNPEETKLLENPSYQKILAHGIVNGIEAYSATLFS